MEYIHFSKSIFNSTQEKGYDQVMRQLINEMTLTSKNLKEEQQHYSLAELESIVYDFVTYDS